MASFTDRLNAAIGASAARPAPKPDTRKRRQYGWPWERAGMTKSEWLRWRDERQPHRLEEAMAFGTPEAVELMKALPGAIVREVRIMPPAEEVPALADVPDAVEDVAAVTVDEAGMSVTDGDVTPEIEPAEEILAVADEKIAPTTSSVSDDDETPPIIPGWPRRVRPR